jgi:hypothetical protein
MKKVETNLEQIWNHFKQFGAISDKFEQFRQVYINLDKFGLFYWP